MGCGAVKPAFINDVDFNGHKQDAFAADYRTTGSAFKACIWNAKFAGLRISQPRLRNGLGFVLSRWIWLNGAKMKLRRTYLARLIRNLSLQDRQTPSASSHRDAGFV